MPLDAQQALGLLRLTSSAERPMALSHSAGETSASCQRFGFDSMVVLKVVVVFVSAAGAAGSTVGG